MNVTRDFLGQETTEMPGWQKTGTGILDLLSKGLNILGPKPEPAFQPPPNGGNKMLTYAVIGIAIVGGAYMLKGARRRR